MRKVREKKWKEIRLLAKTIQGKRPQSEHAVKNAVARADARGVRAKAVAHAHGRDASADASAVNGEEQAASCGIRLLSKVFGQNCSKTPNMGWVVDGRGWGGPEVPGMEVRFFPMAARSTVRGSKLG